MTDGQVARWEFIWNIDQVSVCSQIISSAISLPAAMHFPSTTPHQGPLRLAAVIQTEEAMQRNSLLCAVMVAISEI